MQKPGITLSNAHHQDNRVVSMVFEKDATLINRVKSFSGTGRNKTRKYWDTQNRQINRSHIIKMLAPVEYPDDPEFKASDKNLGQEEIQSAIPIKKCVTDSTPDTNLMEQKHNANNNKLVYR